MNYQEFSVSMLKKVVDLGINGNEYEGPSFKWVIKQLIGVYPETYYMQDGKEMKFFNVDFHSKTYRGLYIWKNLLCSKEAWKLCKDIEEKGIKDKWPFYEHMEPKSVTYKKIQEKKYSKKDLEKILDKCKLVILTKKEKNYLDGKDECFDENDEKLITEWGKSKILLHNEVNDAIKSMTEGEVKPLRCDRHGNYFARIAHLCNKNVEFIWGRYNEKKDDIRIIKQYYKDNNHKLEYFV